jgi:hypothetical protein
VSDFDVTCLNDSVAESVEAAGNYSNRSYRMFLNLLPLPISTLARRSMLTQILTTTLRWECLTGAVCIATPGYRNPRFNRVVGYVGDRASDTSTGWRKRKDRAAPFREVPEFVKLCAEGPFQR